jgi:GNAT superfamily N-acetyltransferase
MVRRAERSEADALAALHRLSIIAHCSSAYSAGQINAWTAVLAPEAYASLIDNADVLVDTDEADGTILGLGVSPSIEVIHAVYVTPGMTRRGVGRALMNAKEALLRDANVPEARLNATLNAARFYRSIGYRDGAPSLNFPPSGIELPCVRMKKLLD